MRLDRSCWYKLADGMAILVLMVTVLMTLQVVWSHPQPMSVTHLEPGLQYQGLQTSTGFLHLVTVDLRSPNIRVELGSIEDPPNTHRLFWLPNEVARQGWSVAVSGGEFETRWGRYAPAGSIGRPTQAVITEGRATQRQTTGGMLWFDEFQTGHLEPAGENSAAWIAARWGIGCQTWLVQQGSVVQGIDTSTRRRTCLGLDQTGCHLWIASFEASTQADAAAFLLSHGVWSAFEISHSENAGIVLNESLTAQWPSRPLGPQRFITHALAIRSQTAVSSSR